MRAMHLMLSGVTGEDFLRRLAPGLGGLPVRQVARLVCSFPTSLAVVETTLRVGTPPRAHGVLFEDEQPRVPPLLDDSLHARVVPTPQDIATKLEAVGADDLVLVSGIPGADATHRQIALDPPRADGLEILADDAFALCSPLSPGAAPDRSTLDRWLATAGVERILAPSDESAGAWMAPTDRGWILVAQPGWSFRSTGPVHGHVDPPAGREPFLVALGAEWPLPWPDAVHDWRVAPTLLAALGREPVATFDRPLAGAERLGG